MLKARVYIIQVCCIIALLFGYFLSDQPDSLSVMHFDPSHPSVINEATKTNGNTDALQISESSTNNPGRKSNVPKYISYELVLPIKHSLPVFFATEVVYHSLLSENYDYLFFKDINPPPPKAC